MGQWTESWTVKLVEDPDTGELILPFPPDLLAQVGWDFGDSIAWDFDGDTIVLTKQDDQDQH
jgi:hypothetical protein